MRFQVLFHSASHRSFHLSLTVLVRYRSPGVFSLGRWSSEIHPGFHRSRVTWVPTSGRRPLFAYRAFTLFGSAFQRFRLSVRLVTSREYCGPLQVGPTTPYQQRPHALTPIWFRLFPVRSPLLRESLLLYFPPGTEMFQFPDFPLCRYVLATQ